MLKHITQIHRALLKRSRKALEILTAQAFACKQVRHFFLVNKFRSAGFRVEMGNIHTVGPNEALVISGNKLFDFGAAFSFCMWLLKHYLRRTVTESNGPVYVCQAGGPHS